MGVREVTAAVYFLSLGNAPHTGNHEQDEGGGCEHPSDITGLWIYRSAESAPGSFSGPLYLIVDIEIHEQRIAACRYGLIVGNMLCVIKLVQINAFDHRVSHIDKEGLNTGGVTGQLVLLHVDDERVSHRMVMIVERWSR